MSHGELQGLRVAVTRPDPAPQTDPLSELLSAEGAVPVPVPLVRIERPPDRTALLACAAVVDGYDWIVFTSANGVRFFAEALLQVGGEGAKPGARIAAVGPATADAVTAQLGWDVAVVPDRFTGAAVAAAMAAVAPLAAARVLWPKAVEAREFLGRDLLAAGARLDAPHAYATRALPEGAAELARMLAEGGVDVVTLTSPSAARCLARAQPRMRGVVVAVIGPSTAEAARDAGLPVHVEPETHTLPGLVAALVRHVRRP